MLVRGPRVCPSVCTLCPMWTLSRVRTSCLRSERRVSHSQLAIRKLLCGGCVSNSIVVMACRELSVEATQVSIHGSGYQPGLTGINMFVFLTSHWPMQDGDGFARQTQYSTTEKQPDSGNRGKRNASRLNKTKTQPLVLVFCLESSCRWLKGRKRTEFTFSCESTWISRNDLSRRAK